MKHKTQLILLFSFIFFGFDVFNQNKSNKIAPLNNDDVEILTEAYNLWKTKGEEIWTGWTRVDIPFIYRKENSEYWINFPSEFNEGEYLGKIGEMAVFGHATDGPARAAAMDIQGIQTVVQSSPKITGMSREVWIITAIHEMFHVYQNSETYQKKIESLNIAYGDDAMWMLDYPFPYDDTLLNTIAHVQGYLAYNIINSDNFDENMYDCFMLKDVIASYRDHLNGKYGSNDNYKYATLQQATEGVAKYTEIKMAEIAAVDYKPLSTTLDFVGLWNENYINQVNVIRHCGKGTSGRLTFYYLGLGKCMVLDKIYPQWKDMYFKTYWLDEIFTESLIELLKGLQENK